MRRPLIGITLCFLLGAWIGLRWILPAAPLGAAFAVLVATGLIRPAVQRWVIRASTGTPLRLLALPATGTVIVLCASLLAGALAACRGTRYPLAPDCATHAPHTPVELGIIGTVSGDPHLVEPPTDAGSIWSLPVDLQRIRHSGRAWRPQAGRIRVRWYAAPLPPDDATATRSTEYPEYGETWHMQGRLWTDRHGSSHPAASTFVTASRLSHRLSSRPAYGLGRLLLHTRRGAARLLTVGIEDRPAATALLHALLLGYRQELPPRTHALFAATGTLHIFAISGLHVGLLCGILIFLLSVLRVPRTSWIVFLAPLLVAYTFATGAKPSAVRACLMALIYFSAPSVGRRPDSLSALALAALVIVAWDPQQLPQLGFVLSFTVVLGLILLFPLIYRRMDGLIQRLGGADPHLLSPAPPLFWERDPAQLTPETRPRIWLRRITRYVAGLAALSIAAWLASAPLTALYFHRFAPIALIGNILVIPLAFLIVLSGCLSLVLGSCAALFADIFNHANLVLIELLVGAMRGLAAVPGGSVTVECVPPGLVTAWYTVLAVVIYLGMAREGAGKGSTNAGANGNLSGFSVDH